jgi:hypothetical protein
LNLNAQLAQEQQASKPVKYYPVPFQIQKSIKKSIREYECPSAVRKIRLSPYDESRQVLLRKYGIEILINPPMALSAANSDANKSDFAFTPFPPIPYFFSYFA